MSKAQEKIEVKQGDYTQGFTVLQRTDNEAEAVRIARKTRKTADQFVMVTRGPHIVFCRY